MLVLSRHKDEKVVLPTMGVEITVIETRSDKVRLGITAPNEVPVHREEVWLSIQQNGERHG